MGHYKYKILALASSFFHLFVLFNLLLYQTLLANNSYLVIVAPVSGCTSAAQKCPISTSKMLSLDFISGGYASRNLWVSTDLIFHPTL